MAVTLVMLKQHEQALFYAQKAARFFPQEGEVHSTLGSILAMMGRAKEAVPILERAIALAPASTNARLGLANALADLNRHSEVVDQSRAGLAIRPDDQELAVKLTLGLLNCGHAEEAVDIATRALSNRPDDQVLASWRAFALNYLPDPDPLEIRAAHERFGRLLEGQVRSQTGFTPAVPPAADRPLRVGIVSPDLRTHSVAFFAEPLLRHTDRSRIELYCYSTAKREDQTTQRLKPMATQWRSVATLSDTDLAARIRADRLDILLDLAGHTSDNSMPVFAARPAPIQASWCGYPATTGLSGISYRLVDSITDPPGSEVHCVERLIRLDPCFLCYQAPAEAPPVAPSPVLADKHITFGSFNTLLKLNKGVVSVWASILQAVPGSRLLLKATQLADPRVRADTVQRFVGAGIEASRVEVVEATASQMDHLALYGRIDIALDPFPYAGTTTTCEAMWAGVPVITLAGRSHAGRVGVSLLRNTGLDELIAADIPSYIKLATSLAGDTARLTSLRSSMRDRIAASTLCDGPAFARRFEAALRQMASSPSLP
ncbi:MAG: tetratricopeptide repeat protein [Phycisphaerales bacterium]|nr:tetratricopeptide repeat protein [Phycisphaerales bacterium]